MAGSKAKPQEPSPAAQVYVGPNMGGDLPMQQFTTFRGGLPPGVSARCEQDQDFAALFVPVSGVAAARADLARPGSPLRRSYETVWAAYAAKRKEGK